MKKIFVLISVLCFTLTQNTYAGGECDGCKPFTIEYQWAYNEYGARKSLNNLIDIIENDRDNKMYGQVQLMTNETMRIYNKNKSAGSAKLTTDAELLTVAKDPSRRRIYQSPFKEGDINWSLVESGYTSVADGYKRPSYTTVYEEETLVEWLVDLYDEAGNVAVTISLVCYNPGQKVFDEGNASQDGGNGKQSGSTTKVIRDTVYIPSKPKTIIEREVVTVEAECCETWEAGLRHAKEFNELRMDIEEQEQELYLDRIEKENDLEIEKLDAIADIRIKEKQYDAMLALATSNTQCCGGGGSGYGMTGTTVVGPGGTQLQQGRSQWGDFFYDVLTGTIYTFSGNALAQLLPGNRRSPHHFGGHGYSQPQNYNPPVYQGSGGPNINPTIGDPFYGGGPQLRTRQPAGYYVGNTFVRQVPGGTPVGPGRPVQ